MIVIEVLIGKLLLEAVISIISSVLGDYHV